ncbi:ATP-binding cassette domain-containing protein [Alkalilimnicola ehrlichii]|uniref:ATP-binding cassette domain-containing protein n=1 Tax=Alkalilimnicola ehrlichii TaxID=351052 RepID=UPI002163B0E3|nr:ATP-binding cassette domain-containing protein [Alkalilimnicola ehrlichii]
MLLKVEGLVAGYAEPVVGPFSFTVGENEIVGLAGPNGSGKSTLLRALVGAARRFRGSIERAASLQLAYQSQHGNRPEELPLKARELVRLMDGDAAALPPRLQALSDVRLDRLSGGQRQLFYVWAALSNPAPLVLLDEPTNNLDPKGVALLEQRLLDLEPGRAAVVVSHESEFLRRVCSRVIELADES